MAPLVTALLVLFGLFALSCIVLWAICVPMIVRRLVASPMLLAHDSPRLPRGEACECHTADGLTLRGTYLMTNAPRRLGVVVFCHELNSDRHSAGRYVGPLLDDGFDVFSFDFRNHGESDRLPNYRPLHWLTKYEADDVEAVVNYLCDRPDADPRGVGLFGISRGGAAALYVASKDQRVRAVVTDGAFANRPVQHFYVRRFAKVHVPFEWLVNHIPRLAFDVLHMWCRLVFGLRRGCRLISVEIAARRIHQPVLMIHGSRDSMIPLALAEQLKARLAGPSKLWVVPGAKHNAAVLADPVEYERRVARFFRRHLGGHRLHRRRNPVLGAVRSWLGQAMTFSGQTGPIPAPTHTPAHSTAETG